MKKLSMIDWAFLQMETPNRQTHVAGLWIFQLPKGYRGHFFQELRESVTDWERVGPPFNFKLKVPALMLDLPSWVEDDQFDLDHHVHFTRLPAPGTDEQLLAWVEHLHGQVLDRSRPLWEIHFIEGVRSRRVAIYCKIHHSLVDGIAGLNMMVNTFSKSANHRATRMLWQPARKTPAENRSLGLPARIGKACAGALGQLRSLPELSVILAKGGLQAINLRQSPVPLPFTAPRTLLNVSVSGKRRLAVHTLSLPAVKALSQATVTTVNDVVLAVCAGALRRYLDAKQALPAAPLVAFMPVSTRSTHDNPSSGNQVAAVLCSLATDQADPRRRFAAVTASARAAKAQFSAQSAAATGHTIVLFGGLVVLTQQWRLSTYIAPPANVVISNVPGPRHALYLNGAKLSAQYPLSMLIDGLALNITITSHGDSLDFGVLACGEALPDVAVLADHLGDAFAELQAAFREAPEHWRRATR